VTEILNKLPDHLSEDKVKAVVAVLTGEAVVTSEQITLAREMKRRYFCTIAEALDTMAPPYVLTSGSKSTQAARLVDRESALDLLEGDDLRSINHVRIIEFLLEYNSAPLNEIRQAVGVSQAILKTMEKNGIIEFFRTRVEKEDDTKIPAYEHELPKIATPEQNFAIDSIVSAATESDKHELKEYMLYGVTGSGKTEVYLQAARQILSMGKEILIMVPEISLTPLMTRRLRSRFGENLAILHSRLSPAERYQAWKKIIRKQVQIVVGARSAVFAPLENIGLIVVDEEQEGTYKAETKPRYHALEIARMRAMLQGAVLVLGSATPSVSSFYRSQSGKSQLLTLPKRIGTHGVAQVQIVDMRRQLMRGRKGLLSDVLEDELRQILEKQQQAMLLLNRRGFSRSIICYKCGWQMRCNHCDVALTAHRRSWGHSEDSLRMVCHYCDRLRPVPRKCPVCDSEHIGGVGMGTQQAEIALQEDFPQARILRMDQDTTRSRTSHDDILSAFSRHEADILLGTQMIAKGHDFHNVTLSAVLSADQMLGTGDYRDAETAFQLMAQMAGRSGRGQEAGKVFFQTLQPEHFVIRTAAAQDYETFYREEISFRERMQYPPFGHLGVFFIRGFSPEDTAEGAQALHAYASELIDQYGGSFKNTDLSAAAPAPINKMRDRYRFRIIARDPSVEVLTRLLQLTVDNTKMPEQVFVSVDIDPWSML
ncbi:MAG: primosomal protein N', partial [Eubacteriales bacterium]|nr:primosomal protein N' [Eubacteriales bacterium]